MKLFYKFIFSTFLFWILTACHTDPVEDYFVKATESPDFFVMNIPANVISFDESKLDSETIQQIHSIKKMNLLVYKNDANLTHKKQIFENADRVINNQLYKTLTKIKNEGYQVVLTYAGDPEKIDEIIFLGKDSKFNFLIGRLKGKNLNINNLIKALKHVQKVDQSQARSIMQIFKQDNTP